MNLPRLDKCNKKIIRQLENFVATGDVSDVPLTQFNQKGKWCGIEQFSNPEFFPEKLAQRLSKLKVPKDVLIRTDDKGKHLQGSYDVTTDKPLTIDYTSIIGNLYVWSDNCPYFFAPNLRVVKGEVCIMSENVDMPSLCHVYGSVLLHDAESLNIPKLKYVDRNLECPDLKKFSAPKLRVVSGLLLASNASDVHLPHLRRTKSSFIAFRATTIFAPKLEKVGGLLNTKSAPDFYMHKRQVEHSLKLHPEAERIFARKELKMPPFEL